MSVWEELPPAALHEVISCSPQGLQLLTQHWVGEACTCQAGLLSRPACARSNAIANVSTLLEATAVHINNREAAAKTTKGPAAFPSMQMDMIGPAATSQLSCASSVTYHNVAWAASHFAHLSEALQSSLATFQQNYLSDVPFSVLPALLPDLVLQDFVDEVKVGSFRTGN